MSLSPAPRTRRPRTARDSRRPSPGRAAVLALVALPGLLFGLITWQVVVHGPLAGADERVGRGLLRPDRTSEVLSDLGNVQIAVPVLVVAAGYAALRGRRARTGAWWVAPVAAAVVMALVPLVVVPVKDAVGRGGTAAVPPGTGYFPSGHAATAVVAYGAAVLVLLPWLRGVWPRRGVVAGAGAVDLGVGYGLVRRGYHWPLDVVASWCLGTVLLTGLVLVIGPAGRLVVSRSTRRRSSGTPRSRTGPS
ncbi:phosphatase PAP2 family protein [Streptomyces sp. NPDC047000]|uniref:phosphatase PAP2 family protein n=1 Tax=Streptomyces sp. NPDC047000 TaxID=3155474 RepID=UPI0033D4316D